MTINEEAHQEEVIKEFLPKIKCLAHRLSFKLPPELSTDDLISAGIIGLIEAMDRFDPDKNTKLKTYAEFRIRGAMIDEIRSMQWASRDVKRKISDVRKAYEDLEMQFHRYPEEDEVAKYLGLTLEDFYEILRSTNSANLIGLEDISASYSDGNMDFLECLSDPNAVDQLSSMVHKETREELGRAIDSLPEKERMVLTIYYYEELTMKEVGAILGLSESRVCQIHSQAILKLKKKCRKAFKS
jgi:RNA polymerase sigma factor for flagellar operon FliA